MRLWSRARLVALAFWVACGGLSAEQGVLVLHVSNPKAKPIHDVVLATQGDGSTGPPTDRGGKTRIRLAPDTRPGSWVSLQVVRSPQDLVFISPWDSRVLVPPFENRSENFAPLVLAERGDRALLEKGKTLASIVASINAASAPKNPNAAVTDAQRAAALNEVARVFGLDRDALDRAIRSVGAASKDPYERGMSALYARNYPEATNQLAQSLQAREKKLLRVPANIANSAMFLGQAFLEQGKYDKAALAYRKALDIRPDDPVVLNSLGLALLKAGKPDEAEPVLQRALELQQQAGK